METTHYQSHDGAPARYAFSLVELSIVLVILGLLVGGVLSGQTLIRSSELRSIITEQQQFITATQSFRGKYFALPGDFDKADQFWGQQVASCHQSQPPLNSKATCKGDGNGRIDNSDAYGTPLIRVREYEYIWHHLENAGLITLRRTVDSLGAPMSKLATYAWYFTDFGTLSALNATGYLVFAGEYGNSVSIGSIVSSDSALRPSELWNIDTKSDDGKPATGKIVAGGDWNTMSLDTCTNTTDNTNLAATYLLASDNKTCNIVFRQQF